MKINIISFNNSHSLSEDCEIISHCLKKFYRNKKLYFQFHNFQEVKASVADVNIFVGLVSNVFFKYSPINILIIDPHKFDMSWISYLPKFQHILCKSTFAQDLIRSHIPNIQVLGWKTKDRYRNLEKDFKTYLCVLGVSVYRQVSTLLELWKEEYPKLKILCGKNYLTNHQITKKEQDNIEYIEEYLPEEKFDKLLNECGVHICLSSASSFNNCLHNALSCNSVPVAIDNVLNKTFVSNNISSFLVKSKKKKKLKASFGSEYLVDREDFTKVIERINQLDEMKLEEMGEVGKKELLGQTRTFEKNFKELYDTVWKTHSQTTAIITNYQKFDEDLPKVSIITPTYNRKRFFELTLRNFQKTDYPKDKIEWIIVDDSDIDDISDIIPKQDNIYHYKLDSKETIGYKRNYAVEKANYDIIVCMDDDDYYQPGSVKYRVACLEHLNKDIVATTSMGILDINKIISNMSVSSFIENYYIRAYESTFAFRRDYALQNKFLEENCREGRSLIENNLERYEEINYGPIMVSLIHYDNTNKRVVVKGDTNGCHFNFSDDLFKLITGLDHQNDDEPVDIERLNKALKKEEVEV